MNRLILIVLAIIAVFIMAMWTQDAFKDLWQEIDRKIEQMSYHQRALIEDIRIFSPILLFVIITIFVVIRVMKEDKDCMEDFRYVQRNGLDAFRRDFGREPGARRR